MKGFLKNHHPKDQRNFGKRKKKKRKKERIFLTTVGFEPTPEDQCLKLAP
jgi:hypothetical protein